LCSVLDQDYPHIEYIVLDDASDTTTAVKNAKRLVSEDQVDLVIGGTLTTSTLAILEVIAEAATPTISLASAARIIQPMDDKRYWMFKTPQTDVLMASGILEHAAARGVKSVAYIGQADTLGTLVQMDQQHRDAFGCRTPAH